MPDLYEAALRLEDDQRVQLAVIFARQRDAWAEAGEDGLATWFGEVVALLCEARSESRRRARDLEIDFARVLGVTAGPGGIVVASRSEAGYPPDSAGRRSAHDARGYPVLSDDAYPIPEES